MGPRPQLTDFDLARFLIPNKGAKLSWSLGGLYTNLGLAQASGSANRWVFKSIGRWVALAQKLGGGATLVKSRQYLRAGGADDLSRVMPWVATTTALLVGLASRWVSCAKEEGGIEDDANRHRVNALLLAIGRQVVEDGGWVMCLFVDPARSRPSTPTVGKARGRSVVDSSDLVEALGEVEGRIPTLGCNSDLSQGIEECCAWSGCVALLLCAAMWGYKSHCKLEGIASSGRLRMRARQALRDRSLHTLAPVVESYDRQDCTSFLCNLAACAKAGLLWAQVVHALAVKLECASVEEPDFEQPSFGAEATDRSIDRQLRPRGRCPEARFDPRAGDARPLPSLRQDPPC